MNRFGPTLARLVVGLVIGASSLGAQDFVLRAGDAIRLLVPSEKDLTGMFEVDLTAAVTLPLLGRVEVAGKPWPELRTFILAAYRRELRDPGIAVTPFRRVLVLGAVNKPGSYHLDPTATLSGAVAAAAGVAPDGSSRRIRIVRSDTVFRADAAREREIADVPIQSGDQIFVLQRGWFARNNTFLITTILSLTGIVATLLLRR